MTAALPDPTRPILEPPERNPLPFRPRPHPGGNRLAHNARLMRKGLGYSGATRARGARVR